MDHVRIGQSLRALRRRRGWTQERLAAASGQPRCVISSIETGAASSARLGSLEGIAEALGARIDVSVRWHGESLDRLLDETHASLVDASVRLLVSLGWEVAPEVSFNVWGERGSIDVLAFHRAMSIVLVVEVKSVVPDLQGMLAALDRKARLAATIAAGRGWRANATARLLVVARSPTTYRRLGRHRPILDLAFPNRSHQVRGWLRRPSLPPISGLLVVSLASYPGAGSGTGRSRRVPTGARGRGARIPRSVSDGP